MSEPVTDTEFEVGILQNCTTDGTYVCVIMSDGIGLGFDAQPGFTQPKPGCVVRVYPSFSLGTTHRGISFENPDGTWQVGYYLTAEQGAERDRLSREDLRRTMDEARRAPIPPTGHAKYEWRPGMDEISGMGGAYEGACRQMVAAGCQHFDENPDGELTFGYGAESAAAKALQAAILVACDDCSGAMMGAATSACLYVRKNGWEAYCAAMTKHKEERV